MGHAQSSHSDWVGVWFEIARVLNNILSPGYTSPPNLAEERKRHKYAALAEAHKFESIVVEMYVWWAHCSPLEGDGPHLVEATGEPREVNWFRQNLAIAQV